MDTALRLRIILDTKEDVFRDLEIKPEHSLEDLHHSIVRSFALQPGEMASFYKSDLDWNQGDEVPFMDMGMSETPITMMREIKSGSVLTKASPNLIYVYDFLNMWTFYVEFIENVPIDVNDDYPRCTYDYGATPETAPSKDFSGKGNSKKDIFSDAFGDDEDNDHFDEEEDLWN